MTAHDKGALCAAVLACFAIGYAVFEVHKRVPPPPVIVSWRIVHDPAPPCPCADLLQPVHITARRYRQPHAPVPMTMECLAPEVEAALPRTIDWPEPPMRSFTPTVAAHFDFSEPLPPAWREPAEYFPPAGGPRPVSVPEPSTWLLMAAGVCGALLFRRRQRC